MPSSCRAHPSKTWKYVLANWPRCICFTAACSPRAFVLYHAGSSISIFFPPSLALGYHTTSSLMFNGFHTMGPTDAELATQTLSEEGNFRFASFDASDAVTLVRLSFLAKYTSCHRHSRAFHFANGSVPPLAILKEGKALSSLFKLSRDTHYSRARWATSGISAESGMLALIAGLVSKAWSMLCVGQDTRASMWRRV